MDTDKIKQLVAKALHEAVVQDKAGEHGFVDIIEHLTEVQKLLGVDTPKPAATEKYYPSHVLEHPSQEASTTVCIHCGEVFDFSDPGWRVLAAEGICSPRK